MDVGNIDIINSDASYIVSNLTNGTLYYFQVAATNSVGSGDYSTEVSATPATTPAQITDLSAVASNMQVTLSWTIPSDGGDPITQYAIKQATLMADLGAATADIVDVGDISINVSTASYEVMSLINETPYYFQVAATNSLGPGDYSTEVSATPFTTPATTPVVPVISFGSPSGNATDASSGSSTALDVSLTVSESGFVSATNITITVTTTSGTIADGDYTLAVKSGSVATLTSANPYTLSVPDGATSITLSFTAEDADSEDEIVTLTLSSAAADIGTQTVHTITITDEDVDPQEDVTSFSVTGNEHGLQIYPNPTYGELRFAGLSALRSYRYKVYAFVGQRVASGIFQGGKAIDLSALPSGQYVLVLEDEEHSEVLRTRLLILR